MATRTNTYKVYLARVIYLESNSFKTRPIIAVSEARGSHGIMMAVPVFSNTKLEDVDVIIKDWQACGLGKSSTAMTHRLAAINGERVLEEIGQLSQSDHQAIKKALRKLYNL